MSKNSFDNFVDKFKTCFNKLVPIKRKKTRYNNRIFMNKSLIKTIKFNNNKSEGNSKK